MRMVCRKVNTTYVKKEKIDIDAGLVAGLIRQGKNRAEIRKFFGVSDKDLDSYLSGYQIEGEHVEHTKSKVVWRPNFVAQRPASEPAEPSNTVHQSVIGKDKENNRRCNEASKARMGGGIISEEWGRGNLLRKYLQESSGSS